MLSRSAQVFAALTLIELAVFALAASQVQPLLLVLFVVASSIFGLRLFFRFSTEIVRSSVEDISAAGGSAPAASRQLGDRAMKVAGAALLSFPGLLTGLIGALLMLPPFRSLIRPLIGSRLSRRMPAESSTPLTDLDQLFRRSRYAGGDVVDVQAVDVTAIRKDPGGSSTQTSAPPELN